MTLLTDLQAELDLATGKSRLKAYSRVLFAAHQMQQGTPDNEIFILIEESRAKAKEIKNNSCTL